MKTSPFITKINYADVLITACIIIILIALKIFDALNLILLLAILYFLEKNFLLARINFFLIFTFSSVVILYLISLLLTNGVTLDLIHLFGLIKIYSIITIFFILRSQYFKNKFKLFENVSVALVLLNLFFNVIQFLLPQLNWSMYTYVFHYNDLTGIKDGLVGLFGSRTINSQILFAGLLYFIHFRKYPLIILCFIMIFLAGIKMVILVAAVYLLFYFIANLLKSNVPRNNILNLGIIALMLLGLYFLIYPKYSEYDILISSSYINRLSTFNEIYDVWVGNISGFFFGNRIDFEIAVDSQWLLILSRHGVLIFLLILYVTLFFTKSILIGVLLVLMGLTSQIFYSPLILFVYFGIFLKMRNKLKTSL